VRRDPDLLAEVGPARPGHRIDRHGAAEPRRRLDRLEDADVGQALQIAAEIEYFARCIRDDLDPEPSGWEGMADVRILQAIQAAARFGRVVPIEPIPRPQRPDLSQEIRIPAHELPALVDVEHPAK